MRKTILLSVAAFILSSCGIAQHREYMARLAHDEDKVDSIKTEALGKTEAHMISLDCENKEIASRIKPGTVFKAPECGLLYDTLVKDRTLEKEICPALKLKGKACVKKAGETYVARVGARYKFADYDKVQEICKTEPLLCKDTRDMEMIILNSNNYALDQAYGKAIDRAHAYEEKLAEARAEEIAAERERSNRAFAAGLNSFAQGFNQGSQSYQPTPYTPSKSLDYNCFNTCTSSGSSYAFCKSKCEY